MNIPESALGWLALFVLMAGAGVLVLLLLSEFLDWVDGSKGDM